MSLMPDFHRDLERAAQRWLRPALRARRVVRSTAPIVVAVAVIAAAAVVLPGASQQPAEVAAPSGPAERAPPATYAALLGSDIDVRPLPDRRRLDRIGGPYRLDLDHAMKIPVPPGAEVPEPDPDAALPREWYLVAGADGFCAIFGPSAACGEKREALRDGSLSMFAGNRDGRPQLLGIVPDGYQEARVSIRRKTIARTRVVHNAYRIVLPARYGAGLPSASELLLIRPDGSSKRVDLFG